MKFKLDDQVKIPKRNDGLVYLLKDIYSDGHEQLKEGQYLAYNCDAPDGFTRAFIVTDNDIVLA